MPYWACLYCQYMDRNPTVLNVIKKTWTMVWYCNIQHKQQSVIKIIMIYLRCWHVDIYMLYVHVRSAPLRSAPTFELLVLQLISDICRNVKPGLMKMSLRELQWLDYNHIIYDCINSGPGHCAMIHWVLAAYCLPLTEL